MWKAAHIFPIFWFTRGFLTSISRHSTFPSLRLVRYGHGPASGAERDEGRRECKTSDETARSLRLALTRSARSLPLTVLSSFTRRSGTRSATRDEQRTEGPAVRRACETRATPLPHPPSWKSLMAVHILDFTAAESSVFPFPPAGYPSHHTRFFASIGSSGSLSLPFTSGSEHEGTE